MYINLEGMNLTSPGWPTCGLTPTRSKLTSPSLQPQGSHRRGRPGQPRRLHGQPPNHVGASSSGICSGIYTACNLYPLPETGSSPSAKWIVECCFSGTRQRRLCRVFFLTLDKEALYRVFFFTLGNENFKSHFEAVN